MLSIHYVYLVVLGRTGELEASLALAVAKAKVPRALATLLGIGTGLTIFILAQRWWHTKQSLPPPSPP